MGTAPEKHIRVLEEWEEDRERTRAVVAIGAVAVLYYLRQLTGSPQILAQTPALSFLGHDLAPLTISSDIVMQFLAIYIMGLAIALIDRWIEVESKYAGIFRHILNYAYGIAKIAYYVAVIILVIAGAIWMRAGIAVIILIFIASSMVEWLRKKTRRNRQTPSQGTHPSGSQPSPEKSPG